MKSQSSRIVGLIVVGLACVVAGCGGGAENASPEGEPATVAEAGGSDERVCNLLTSDQVSSVLPGHDGGSVMHSGGSLLQGVDAYQCSYTVVSGTDVRLLNVILNVASTDEMFEEIKPSGFAYEKEEAVTIGDGGWSSGSAGNWKIKALKGRTMVDLELMAPDAKAKADQLLALARGIVEAL